MRQLVYTIFITNSHASFHLGSNENLMNHEKVSKFYEGSCLQNVLLLLMCLLKALIVENIHILAGVYFAFLKNPPSPNFKRSKTTFGRK